MKTRYLFLLNALIGLCFLVACTNDEPTPVAQAITTDVSLTPTLPATTTATTEPIAAAVTPSLPIAAMVTPTTTLIPYSPPTGRIIFLWDQAIGPVIDGPARVQPTISLFQGLPGHSPDDWDIQPLLTDIFAITPSYLAPDQSKLALLVLNEDMSSYSNFFQIWIYTFATGLVTRIENQESLYTLSWLPDSETIIYPQLSNLFQVKLSDLMPQQLTENPLPLAEHGLNGLITQIAGSSDGLWQVVNGLPGDLTLYNVPLETTTILANQIGYHWLKLNWSPNSQWLAFTRDFGLDLYVTNTETFSVTQLAIEPSSIYYSAWSPDSHWLAYTQSSVLFLWDTATQTTDELVISGFIGEPAWSPDGLTLAVGFSEGTDAGILLIRVSTGEVVKIKSGMTTGKIIWSPDGQWLLFPSSQNEQRGLYLFDLDTEAVYLVVDTSSKLHDPSFVTWLP